MSDRKASRTRRAKLSALFRNPLLDEHPSPAKDAVWTGHLPEEPRDALTDLRLWLPTAPTPSREQLEDRAKRIQHKIASWDREKLETYYVRTLLSALLLQKSQRLLGEALPVLSAMAKQQASHKELRETARLLVLYANTLFDKERKRRPGYSDGGTKTAKGKIAKAQLRHDEWLAIYNRLLASGTEPRYIAGTIATEKHVSSRAMREGIKEAQRRAEKARAK